MGAIVALSPALGATPKAAFNSWGPGRYDARFNIDGLNKPTVIPPAYGLAGLHRITATGDGDDIACWNRYVAVTQMGGQGTFTEPRQVLSITNGTRHLVSRTPPALRKAVFEGAGRCATCHGDESFTDANSTLHPTADSLAEPESPGYAARSATKLYRSVPLRGLWQHAPYFHDGSAATLEDVGRLYNTRRALGLSALQVSDLAQYLKSL